MIISASEQHVGERACKLRAISMDMGHPVRQVSPRARAAAIVCIDPYHVVQLANKALDEVRRAYWNELRQLGDQDAAKRFRTRVGRCVRHEAPTNRAG